MSFYQGRKSLPQRFRLILSSVLQTVGLPFAEVLGEQEIQDAFDQHDVAFAPEEEDVYTPAITLWAFLSQVLHKGEQRSCLAAVSRVMVLLVALGREPCAKNSGAYCRARAKVPEAVIKDLTLEVARGCERAMSSRWLWKERHVKLADGTTVTMSDTEANQEEYPQHSTQKEGLGFPIARLVVLVSLATAMVGGMAIGPYSGKETGELALMRELLGQLDDGDVLLTDRYFCSYFLIAMLLELGVDFVTRRHHARKDDFTQAKRLGKGDYQVEWPRPQRPDWMDVETYQQMPKTITVRQVEVQVNQPGFRVDSFVVVTTLTDIEQYTRKDLAELYHKRWLIELDIASIKVTLGMDELRCKSPEMIRAEIWTCLLAYNLIRKTMLQAAAGKNLSPRQLSFALAVQTMAASWVLLPTADKSVQVTLIETQIASLTGQLVGNRPGRIEPRAIKRRPKPHRLLTMTREEARDLLLQGIDPYAKKK
ncbi:MAG: IS4 family transposase [Acidimicrobiia bacterium]